MAENLKEKGCPQNFLVGTERMREINAKVAVFLQLRES